MKHLFKKTAPILFKTYIVWSLIVDVILLSGIVYVIFNR